MVEWDVVGFKKSKNDFTGRACFCIDKVDITKEFIGIVMIDIDDDGFSGNAWKEIENTAMLETARIKGYNHVPRFIKK